MQRWGPAAEGWGCDSLPAAASCMEPHGARLWCGLQSCCHVLLSRRPLLPVPRWACGQYACTHITYFFTVLFVLSSNNCQGLEDVEAKYQLASAAAAGAEEALAALSMDDARPGGRRGPCPSSLARPLARSFARLLACTHKR